MEKNVPPVTSPTTSQSDLSDGNGPGAVASAIAALGGLRGRGAYPLPADTTDARHGPRQSQAGGCKANGEVNWRTSGLGVRRHFEVCYFILAFH